MIHKDSFCVYPFVQIVSRTDKKLGPCCYISGPDTLNDHSLRQFWTGSGMHSLRQKMIEGRPEIPECSRCQKEEKIFGSSMRTSALADYGFLDATQYQILFDQRNYGQREFAERLEIHVGNLCNLKCLTCNPKDSSMFLTENRQLGISDHRQADYTMTDQQLDGLLESIKQHPPKILDLRGGESMLVPAIRRNLLDMPQCIYDNTRLRIQTNGTIYNDEWRSIFSRFKQIEIHLSIDAVGDHNHYIRYPSDWTTIEDNLDNFRSHNPINIYVVCTVSNLNLLALPDLIDWCTKKEIYLFLSLLNHPKHFQFNNLPHDLLQQAQGRLSDYGTGYEKIAKLLAADSLGDHDLWRQFCNTIDVRDAHRNNSIFDIYPEMQQHWITH